MQNYQHRTLTNINDNGFGVKLENRNSAYTPPHWHQAVELLLFIKGKASCKFANTTIHFRPGDLYIINSYEVHETRCSRDAEYLCVHLVPTALCRWTPDFDRMSFSLSCAPGEMDKINACSLLKQYMEQILSAMDSETPTAELDIQTCLFASASLLVRFFSKTLAAEESQTQRSDMTRLEPVMEYVHLHHGEELTLEAAADSMGLNKEYFCRLFKKNMGISYLQYVYQVRTTAVCRELESSEDPIGVIAERHGFKDMKLLSRCFKELYGCTPSEKRKLFREITR